MINITDYPYFSYNKTIDLLMAPLKCQAPVSLLGFRRLFPNRERFLISYHHQWAIEFYGKGLYNLCLYEQKPHELKSSYDMWDHLSCPSPEIYKQFNLKFDLAHGLTIVKQHQTYCDVFEFSPFHSHRGINNFYLNGKELFENFIASFYEAFVDDLDVLSRHCFKVQNDATLSQKSFAEITKRQLQCIVLATQGLSCKEIAKALNLSPRTIEDHLSNLKEKFKARNRTHLCQIVKPLL